MKKWTVPPYWMIPGFVCVQYCTFGCEFVKATTAAVTTEKKQVDLSFLEEAKFVVVALSSHWLRMVFWTWFSYVFMFLNCHIWMSWLAGVRWIHQSMKTAFRKSFNFSDLAWRRRCSQKFNIVHCNYSIHSYCISFTTWEIEFAEFPKHDLAAKICCSLCQGDRQCLLAACSAVERICQDNLPFRSLVCAVFPTV